MEQLGSYFLGLRMIVDAAELADRKCEMLKQRSLSHSPIRVFT